MVAHLVTASESWTDLGGAVKSIRESVRTSLSGSTIEHFPTGQRFKSAKKHTKHAVCSTSARAAPGGYLSWPCPHAISRRCGRCWSTPPCQPSSSSRTRDAQPLSSSRPRSNDRSWWLSTGSYQSRSGAPVALHSSSKPARCTWHRCTPVARTERSRHVHCLSFARTIPVVPQSVSINRALLAGYHSLSTTNCTALRRPKRGR